jgi:hypothetical protein
VNIAGYFCASAHPRCQVKVLVPSFGSCETGIMLCNLVFGVYLIVEKNLLIE